MQTKFSEITVDLIKPSLKKGVNEVQLRQVVTKQYAGINSANSLSDALFSIDELGVKGEDYKENRVIWQIINKETTKTDVEARLALFPNARIMRTLSNYPILTEEQKNVITNGLKGEAFNSFCVDNQIEADVWNDDCRKVLQSKIEDNQIVKNSDTKEVILYNGAKQYKFLALSLEGKPDLDLRKPELSNTESIQITNTVEVTEKVTS